MQRTDTFSIQKTNYFLALSETLPSHTSTYLMYTYKSLRGGKDRRSPPRLNPTGHFSSYQAAAPVLPEGMQQSGVPAGEGQQSGLGASWLLAALQLAVPEKKNNNKIKKKKIRGWGVNVFKYLTAGKCEQPLFAAPSCSSCQTRLLKTALIKHKGQGWKY